MWTLSRIRERSRQEEGCAVWGTRIDVIDPQEKKKLAENMVTSGGAIVSEFPLDVSCTAELSDSQPRLKGDERGSVGD